MCQWVLLLRNSLQLEVRLTLETPVQHLHSLRRMASTSASLHNSRLQPAQEMASEAARCSVKNHKRQQQLQARVYSARSLHLLHHRQMASTLVNQQQRLRHLILLVRPRRALLSVPLPGLVQHRQQIRHVLHRLRNSSLERRMWSIQKPSQKRRQHLKKSQSSALDQPQPSVNLRKSRHLLQSRLNQLSASQARNQTPHHKARLRNRYSILAILPRLMELHLPQSQPNRASILANHFLVPVGQALSVGCKSHQEALLRRRTSL